MGTGVPPEVFLVGEMIGAAEVGSLDDVVVAAGALHPAPEVVPLELVLVAQLQHARLQGDYFLSGEGLANAVGEFKLGGDAIDVHVISVIQTSIQLI
jgi:hypothetical protein